MSKNTANLLARFALPNRFLSAAECAAQLGISPRKFLAEYVYPEAIPSAQIGQRYKVHATDLVAFMDRKRSIGIDQLEKDPMLPVGRAIARHTDNLSRQRQRRAVSRNKLLAARDELTARLDRTIDELERLDAELSPKQLKTARKRDKVRSGLVRGEDAAANLVPAVAAPATMNGNAHATAEAQS